METLLNKLKTLAVLISLLLFNISVYSQSVISSVSVSRSAAIISNHLFSEEYKEIELNKKSENWMSNRSYLDFNLQLSVMEMMLVNEEVIEEDEQIEGWMTNQSVWQIKKQMKQSNIIEESGQVEEWMIDESFWQLQTNNKRHPLEEWMTDSNFWVTVD